MSSMLLFPFKVMCKDCKFVMVYSGSSKSLCTGGFFLLHSIRFLPFDGVCVLL